MVDRETEYHSTDDSGLQTEHRILFAARFDNRKPGTFQQQSAGV
jgi:hypothetical protein